MIFATIAGNVGKDATLRQAGNDQVCSFSVASSKKSKDGDETTWVECSLWGKRGESLVKYITQGSKITVVGELYQESYNDKTRLKLRVSDVALQGSRGDTAAKTYGNGAGANAKRTAPADDFVDEDVPF